MALATRRPPEADVPASRWSLDELAMKLVNDHAEQCMSRSTIQRILHEAELQPHRSRRWLHSGDPDFEAEVLDVARLYLEAPRLYQRGELVICVDEKTGIQALERKHPTRPMQPGRPQRREYEYIRHGVRCLLGSFVVATGQVIGDVTTRRTRRDFCAHLRGVAAAFAGAVRVHWVMDNLNTHWSLELWADRPAERRQAAAARVADGRPAAGVPDRPGTQASDPFHAQARQSDEPDRDLVRETDATTAAPRGLPLGPGPGRPDPPVHRLLQPLACQAVPLDLHRTAPGSLNRRTCETLY